VSGAHLDRTRMQRHPYVQFGARRPRLAMQRTLGGERRGNGIGSRVESRVECVATGFE